MASPREPEELREIGEELIRRQFRCLDCGSIFKFGDKADRTANVFTDAGKRELPITQICERCYDCLFTDD